MIRLPFTINRLSYVYSWLFSLHYGEYKTDHGKRTENGKQKTVNSSRGDTIVEVVIVTAILAVVLAGSYSLTSHALQNGIDSNKRTEALSIAQRQVEYLKDLYLHSADPDNALNPFRSASGICLVNSGGSLQTPPPSYNDPSRVCSDYGGSGVAVKVTYASDIFSVNAAWEGFSNHQNEVNLYYKAAF
jgi:type II secretory pathway pseudopilin PulG